MNGYPPPSLRLRAVHLALADPLRIRLLELLALQPRSARELAGLTGRPPNRLYHHLARLEEGGLIEVTEHRQVPRGKVERVYAPTAVEPPGDAASPAENAQFLSAVLEATRADVAAAFQAAAAGENRTVRLGRSAVRLSERHLAELSAAIEELIENAAARPDDDGVWTTVLWAMVDRQDRGALPSPAGGGTTAPGRAPR